jgi:N6-L-threonylcarbamoyladenine synthase
MIHYLRMRILGIETSCDETAAAVVEDGHKLLSNVISSSVDMHITFGGVVPEIAARSHIELIIPIVQQALGEANLTWDEIDGIAVTQGPGLIGSLLVGVLVARTLAVVKDKPLFPINHVLAHTYANFLNEKADIASLQTYELQTQPVEFPFLAIIISGGHSQIVLYKSHKNYNILGQTRDDAVGEAFDKVAKILGLPYPGGPSVSKAAMEGDSAAIKLPKAKLDSPYEFSFSGLKTAVLRSAQSLAGKDYTFPSFKLADELNDAQKNNLAASFQKTAVDTLAKAVMRAEEEYQPSNILLAGGVAANSALREALRKELKTPLLVPDIKLCTDNAAMIAASAFYSQNHIADPYKLAVIPSL